MKKLILPCIIALHVLSCGTKKSTDNSERQAAPAQARKVLLEKIWETDTLLTTAECAIYDPSSDIIYVSCIGSMPSDAKDGDGFITKVDTKGNIVERQWFTGLNAPKGLGISNGKLYIADIDALDIVDIGTGKLESHTIIPNAVYLNDIYAATSGDVYIVDSGRQGIFLFKEGAFSSLIHEDSLGRPNGVLLDGDKILSILSNAGHLVTLNKENKTFTSIASGMPRGDGIIRFKENYILSSWSGAIYATSLEGGPVDTLLDTSLDKINAADIGSIDKDNVLLVPTFFDNRVMAYKMSYQ